MKMISIFYFSILLIDVLLLMLLMHCNLSIYQMIKNILLPGGIGYIGSHVVLELLLNTQHNVTILDNYYNSSPVTLQRIFESLSLDLSEGANVQKYKQRVHFFKANILNLQQLDKIFNTMLEENKPITTIIHFAAMKSAPQSVQIPLTYYDNNLVGSMNLLKIMQKYPICDEFIFSSSAAVYGQQDNCNQLFQCLPISPYGQSKLCVDWLLRSMAKSHPQWKVISLRYFNPAGNHWAGILGDNPIGNTPGNLFSIIQQVIIGIREQLVVYGSDYNTTDGTGVRDYIHVVDLAKGHLKALEFIKTMKIPNYQIFNLGSQNGFSVLEVINQFSTLLKKDLKYKIGNRREGDLQRLVTASSKAEQLLGWKAQLTLKDMCESCVKFTIRLREMRRPEIK